MRPDVGDGGKNVNEQNTPPKKTRKTYKEYLAKFMFASVSQQRMAEWGDEVSFSLRKEGMRETMTNLVWSSPEGDGYTPSTKNAIFVDCSSDMGDAYDSDPYLDKAINPRLLFAIEKIKTLLYKKSLKNNEKGKVHCIIAAYHPCEKHMFALSNLFGHSLPEQSVYSKFISFINSRLEYKYALRWIEEEYGWTFDVQYCCVFEGYDIVAVDKEGEEKEKLIKGLQAELDEVQRKHNGNNGLEYANGNYDDRDWGDPKYGTAFITTKNHEKWSDDPHYGTGASPSAFNYNYAVPTINYRGEWCTTNDLKHKLDNDYSPNYMHAQANKMEDAYKEKEVKRKVQLAEIQKKREALERQMNDNTSAEYKEWAAIENEEKANAKKYEKEINGNGPGYSHHRRDQIEYHGAFVTLSELDEKERNIQTTMANERREFESLKDDATKKAKWLQAQEDAKTSIGLAIASLVFPPFAIFDICFEVHKWIRDKDSIVDGLKNHGLGIGFDVVGLIPYIGGIAKLARGAVLSSRATKALANVAKATEQLNTAEKAISTLDKVEDAAKAVDKAQDAVNNTQKVIEIQEGFIKANNEKIADIMRQMARNNPATNPKTAKKIADNEHYISVYKDALKGMSPENAAAIEKRIGQLEAQNATIKKTFEIANNNLAGQIKSLQAENAALRQGINSLTQSAGQAGEALASAQQKFNTINSTIAAKEAAAGEIISELEKYQRAIASIEKQTLTALAEGNSFGVRAKQLFLGKGLPGVSKWDDAMDTVSKAWAVKGAYDNANEYIDLDLSINGWLYFEDPEKKAQFIEQQIASLPPKTLDLIERDVDRELAMAQATQNLDITLDNKIRSLMNQRGISEEEAMQALVDQYSLGDVQDTQFNYDIGKGFVNENDLFTQVLKGNYNTIPDNTPLSDEEIIDFQNSASIDKGIEQSIQADLEQRKQQYLKAHANDGKVLEAADKKYDMAFGNMVEAYSDAQSKADGFRSLMEEESDPELKAFYKSEMENWQWEADNLDSPYPKPIGIYADTIKDYNKAKKAYENASDQFSYNSSVIGNFDNKIEESKKRENDADIKIEKADQALEAGQNINNANERKSQIDTATNEQISQIDGRIAQADERIAQAQDGLNNLNGPAYHQTGTETIHDNDRRGNKVYAQKPVFEPTEEAKPYYDEIYTASSEKGNAEKEKAATIDKAAEDKMDADDEIYTNTIIRKNREDDIRSLM